MGRRTLWQDNESLGGFGSHSQEVAQLAALSLCAGLSPKNCFLSDSIIFIFLHHQNSSAGL